MTQIILPDTPSSVLQLLNADKAALEKFANTIIQDVKQGRENPLEIQLLIKKYEFVLNEMVVRQFTRLVPRLKSLGCNGTKASFFILIGIILLSCSSFNQNYKRTQGKEIKHRPRYSH